VTTAPPDAEVIGATPADLDALSEVIAEAFHDLAPSRWLITDPEARRAIFPRYFRLITAHAMAAGLVHTTPGRDAVALWLPAGPGVPGPLPGYQQRLDAATAPWTGRFAVFDQALAAHHPAGIAHQYLAILAVRPGQQSRGIGSALLNARHHDLDHDRVPAYLEATSPRARDLYLWHGYTARPGAAFRLPEGPLIWPMWREPRVRIENREDRRDPGWM
jgi:GNAT superfamily N-acetyltransferase